MLILYIRTPNHTGHVTSVGDGAQTLVVAAITGQTALTSGLASTDELLVNDGGAIKRMDVSVIQDFMQNNLSFGGGGAFTSFIIEEGNGTEQSTVTDGETVKFAQGTGMEVELTSTTSGGTLTFSLAANGVSASQLNVSGNGTYSSIF